jgi:uncharacterized membrane protein YhiD involved in acid resistance
MEKITFQRFLDSLNIDSVTAINQDLNIWIILLNLAVAFAIVMFIYFIYKTTFSGVLYSKNFNVTLVMVSLVTTAAVIIISSNIVLALGMVGALSIVRFRMAVKDPKDIGFLFWAITNGIICGISAYSLAVVSALFIGLVIFLLSKRIRIIEPFLLILDTDDMDLSKIEAILKKYTILYKLRSKIIDSGKTQVIMEIKIKKDRIGSLLSEIKETKDITFSKLVSYEGDLNEG